MENRDLVYFVLVLTCMIEYSGSFSYNPYCWVGECCNKDNIPGDTDKLRTSLQERVYGQHFTDVVVDAISDHWNSHVKPKKALTLSFHGWAGSGKNYVAKFVAESLFKEGMHSKFVHYFIGSIHFPEEQKASIYQENLYSWVKHNISQCAKQLFIFEDVHIMPSSILNAIKPMIDYRNNVDGVDYTNSIFIVMSNTGQFIINEHYLKLWKSGKTREDMTLGDFESLIKEGAFNEKGGFQYGDSLIDHYIPFLPMQETHVRECILDQFSERHVYFPKEEHIKEVMEFVEWGPEDIKLFSKSGCERISSQVAVLVAKYYRSASEKQEL